MERITNVLDNEWIGEPYVSTTILRMSILHCHPLKMSPLRPYYM